MSPSDESGPTVQLTVRPNGAPAEVYLLDGNFRLVGSGFGTLEAKVAKGAYKVRLRAGWQSSEQHILVRGDQPAVETTYDAPAFSSPAPLAGTAKTHEYQVDSAETNSRVEHQTPGSGAWIYVFARDWTSAAGAPRSTTAPNPAQGLTLRRVTGELVVDLDIASKADLAGDPWAACNVRVDPGTYLLVLDLGDKGSVRRTLVAAKGWQTQVFMLQQDYRPLTDLRRADLLGAAVFMTQPLGFDPGKRELQLTELARQSLTDPRGVVRDQVNEMLRYKPVDPMLGIYGAHLLLAVSGIEATVGRKESPPKAAVPLQEIVENLRLLLTTIHPDVEALAIRAGLPAKFDPATPPMLLQSWRFVCRATATRSDLVPPESLTYQVTDQLWGTGPWLVWREDAGTARTAAAKDDAERAVAAALSSLTRRGPLAGELTEALAQEALRPDQEEVSVAAAEAPVPTAAPQASPPSASRGGPFSPTASLPRGAALGPGTLIAAGYQKVIDFVTNLGSRGRAAAPEEATWEVPVPVPTTGASLSRALRDLHASLDDETVARLVRTVGLPRGKVEEALGNLEGRLANRRD